MKLNLKVNDGEDDIEINSEDGSDFNVECLAFLEDELLSSLIETTEDDVTKNFVGNEIEWNTWEEIGNNDIISGLEEVDRCNGLCNVKEGIVYFSNHAILF